MESVEKSIDVDVPLRTVYNQWTQFEEFPRFMEGVKEVRQLDDKRLAWIAELGGKEVTWVADIVEQVPDQLIRWQSSSGARNSGEVRFSPRGANSTQIALKLGYEPQGFDEKMGDFLGVLGRRVHGDLKRFKSFIEERQQETGGWRGEIHGGQVQRGAGEF